MSNENETKTEVAEVLKTPEDWCRIEGVEILDADGWRGRDGRDWTDPISLAEFQERLRTCTQRSVALPAPNTRRLASCVKNWPDCESGQYNPACCRFPKSCSATVYDPLTMSEEDLEPAAPAQPAGEHHAHKPGHIEGDHVVTVQVSCELLAQLHEWSDPVQAQIQHHSGLQPEYTMEFRTHACPAEHHTGTLNLTGEGNEAQASPISDAIALTAAEAMHVYDKHDPWDDEGCNDTGTPEFPFPSCKEWTTGMARAALTAALPALRRQIAEEIAAKGDEIAEQYQATAVEHRRISLETGSAEPKGQQHLRTAHAFRNKADGAWAVAHAARETGDKA